MNKETILKSVHIAFNEVGLPDVQLQRLERVSFEGEVIREMYLPHERFSLSSATKEETAALKVAIGTVTGAQGQKIDELSLMLEQERSEAETRFGQVVLERDKAVAQAGELAVQLEVARAEVQP